MNKLLLPLNIILVIAVIILFYFHYHKTNNNAQNYVVEKNNSSTSSDFKMGYFDLDSIDNNYKYEEDVKDALMDQDKEVNKQINDLQEEVQQRYAELMKKGVTSQEQQTANDNELRELNQRNQSKAQQIQQSWNMDRNAKLQQVKQRIQNYLKVFAQENGYNYIVGTSDSDPYFYFKDSTQNITIQLVQKLNQLYDDSLKSVKK